MKIEPRRLRFHIPKELPRFWNGDSAVKSYLFNAIAILAPAFERLAISSVLPFKNQHLPMELALHLQAFIEQESAHGSEFIRFNQILKTQGYDVRLLEKANLKNFKWLANKLSLTMHLSLTLAAEHITALISEVILKDPSWLGEAPSCCQALWRWHAIEEIEHKAVAYDVFQTKGGRYWQRIAGMGLMSLILVSLLSRNFLHMAKKDGLIMRLSFWHQTFKICWGKRGFIRQLWRSYWEYYLPGFHPWKQQNANLIQEWKLRFANSSSAEEVVKILQDN